MGVRQTKQETTEARQEIDSLHLQLQNLYYEQRHLRGEIAGCEEFEYAVASTLLSMEALSTNAFCAATSTPSCPSSLLKSSFRHTPSIRNLTSTNLH